MSVYASKNFWLGVAERAVKTFAQALLAGLVVGQTLAATDWATLVSVATVAALASVLTSLADPQATDVATIPNRYIAPASTVEPDLEVPARDAQA